MEGKFYVMYMNYPEKNHDQWAEKNRGMDKLTKRAGSRVRGVVKTQLDLV